jgi:hypothetical protein
MIDNYQKEIMKMSLEIKTLKANEQGKKEERDLRGSRKEMKY